MAVSAITDIQVSQFHVDLMDLQVVVHGESQHSADGRSLRNRSVGVEKVGARDLREATSDQTCAAAGDAAASVLLRVNFEKPICS